MSNSKLIWVDIYDDSWDNAKEKVTGALEAGADGILVSSDNVARVRELGKTAIISDSDDADIKVVGIGSESDGTMPLPGNLDESKDLALSKEFKSKGITVAAYIRLKGKEYERLASRLGKVCDCIIIEGNDWKVIPLENLIAELSGSDVKIIAKARNIDEAAVAARTLEKGADGILIDTDDPSKIREIVHAVKAQKTHVSLKPAEVTAVKDAGMGDRVCIDTCSIMAPGEGMLIGNQSSGLFLIQSESEESPYVASRPFRVNAGAVHEYILVNEKTRYLSELASGDPALIVDKEGNARGATIGRIKIERRPLLYVEAEVDGHRISAILQNAETIKLVGADGSSIPVTRLKAGDSVLVRSEEAGRHFGMKVKETIIEK